MSRKPCTHDQFQAKVEAEFGDEYRVLGQYVNNATKILVKHNLCESEPFLTKPNDFLQRKGGCKVCKYKKLRVTKAKSHEQFVSEVKSLVGDEYTVIGRYVNNETKLRIRHNCESCDHHEYEVRPVSFTSNGRRCPICARSDDIKRLREYIPAKSHEQFVSEVKSLVGDEYTVIGRYVNNKEKLEIRHAACDSVYQVRPNDFLTGYRCPVCNPSLPKQSRAVREIEGLLRKLGIRYETEIRFDECRDKLPLSFDFGVVVSDEEFILIEYDGAQHFESRGVITNKRVQDSIRRDRIKDDFCEENGISLYRIRHNENHKQRIVQILDKHHLVDVKLL